MGQNKLIRFEEIRSFPNVLIYPWGIKGKWHDHFDNHHPITLELACGKGDYTLGLARLFPERNFIGVDIKGNRIWKGARTALGEGLKNAAFLRAGIEMIGYFFERSEVQEIWITFPDPYPGTSRAKKRLTHEHFLEKYRYILNPGGLIHLKTDSEELFSFTQDTLEDLEGTCLQRIPDVYEEPGLPPELQIQTFYEKMHLAEGRTIRYLRFSL